MKPETQEALRVLRGHLDSGEFQSVRDHVRYVPSNSAQEPDVDTLLDRVEKYGDGFAQLFRLPDQIT